MLNQVLGPMLANFTQNQHKFFTILSFFPFILLSLIVPQVLQKKKLKRAGKAESHFSKDKDIDYLFTLISNR
jgi:hypothetical protein